MTSTKNQDTADTENIENLLIKNVQDCLALSALEKIDDGPVEVPITEASVARGPAAET
jgi:hypothetical protein